MVGFFLPFLHLQTILSKMVVFHFKNKEFPRFSLPIDHVGKRGQNKNGGECFTLYKTLPTSVPVDSPTSVVSIPMLWVRVLFLSARPSVSSANRKCISLLMLTLAVMKVVQKYVKSAIGRVSMLNKARVDKAFPTFNGFSSNSGYKIKVCKGTRYMNYQI